MNMADYKSENIGLYIHIPFCKNKCPYCDFYSSCNHKDVDRYTEALLQTVAHWGEKLNRTADTLYFGGGTPPLLGLDNLKKIMSASKKHFNLNQNTEITCEVNPCSVNKVFLQSLYNSGVNRLSIGVQSGIDSELITLGRKHNTDDVTKVVKDAKEVGFSNISLDLMLGTPNQTVDSLKSTLSFMLSLKPTHISAYLLKIEPDTVFGKKPPNNIPNEDLSADLYEMTVEILSKEGYNQYETSNFALSGFESRHNLKYWLCEEYLGIGASAHSFIEGKRFYYPRNTEQFINGIDPIPDGDGGDYNEYAMLNLRLSEGLNFARVKERFGISVPEIMIEKARHLQKLGLLTVKEDSICLTPKGQLLSNQVILQLLDID